MLAMNFLIDIPKEDSGQGRAYGRGGLSWQAKKFTQSESDAPHVLEPVERCNQKMEFTRQGCVTVC